MSHQPDDSFYESVPQAFGHPKAIWFLFITEMWERFSYYGMRALLIYYMTQNFLFSDEKSYGLYGAYTALVYLAPLFGGIAADRVLGNRKAITVGALLMALGHFFMAFQVESIFYLALSLLIVGNGFFKPNMSTIIGRLYPQNDPRRDSGYTIFYMGVNLGAMLAPLGCGTVGAKFGYHWGFTLAGFGMLTGLIVFLRSQRMLRGVADPPHPETIKESLFAGINREWSVYGIGVLCVGGVWWLIQQTELVGSSLLVLVGLGLGTVFVLSLAREKIERERMWVILVLVVFAIAFWALFEQAGSSLSLFAERNVDNSVLGIDFHPSLWQSVNPAFILLFGSLFAWLWVWLAKRNLNPSTPLKFGLGIVQLGLGYAALYNGALSNQSDGILPVYWLALGYMLHTTGELCLSPVGLSMVSKLAPPNMGAFMMGTWYLGLAAANWAASEVAKLTRIENLGAASAADTVMIYGSVYGKLALFAVLVGVFLSLISPIVRKGMHGID